MHAQHLSAPLRDPISEGYPADAYIVSLLEVLENGASAEIAVVGYEGIDGISAVRLKPCNQA